MRSIIISILFLLFGFAVSGQIEINKEDIEIVRDQWGVPHIYAKTDQQLVYGLAWTTCEDVFDYLLENVLAIRGRLGEVKGKDGAVLDFVAHFLGVEKNAALYYHELSDDYKLLIKTYVTAINNYAALHPEELPLKGITPFTEMDMVAGYLLAMSFINNVQYEMLRLFENKINRLESYRPVAGSNALIFNSKKTVDGKTFLAINSHQPLEGPYSWYEAHLNSEESGINILGGTFPGGMSIFHGTTPNHAWAHTVNWPDFTDVYRLSMHPNKKLNYKYDGEWKTLEVRKKTIKVKVGPIKIPVSRTFYWSQYGATIKAKDGNFYSIRFPGNMEVRSSQQWFELNKAKNIEEFKTALDLGWMAGTNIVYGDIHDNIFFISNGIFPDRDPNYDWRGILPGDTSATFYERSDRIPVKELLQITNPASGYLFNTNHSPYKATADADNVKPEEFNPTINYSTLDNNRSIRMRKLVTAREKYTYEQFKAIKYDKEWEPDYFTSLVDNLPDLFQAPPGTFLKHEEVLSMFRKWDRKTTADSPEAGFLALFIHFVLQDLLESGEIPRTGPLPVDRLLDILGKTEKHLKKHFGTLKVPLGELMLHVRGDKTYPAQGTPDVIAAMYMKAYKRGRFQTDVGESYIQFVQLSTEGVKIESVNAYGASNKTDSPHFDDQVPLFLNEELKSMTLDREEIFKNAVRIYNPK